MCVCVTDLGVIVARVETVRMRDRQRLAGVAGTGSQRTVLPERNAPTHELQPKLHSLCTIYTYTALHHCIILVVLFQTHVTVILSHIEIENKCHVCYIYVASFPAPLPHMHIRIRLTFEQFFVWVQRSNSTYMHTCGERVWERGYYIHSLCRIGCFSLP